MSPRNKVQNDAARQSSIDRIMEACLRLFSSQGYAATSVSQIAKEAGVSKGLLYNYFDSKLDMLKELFTYFFQEEEEIMKKIISDDPRTFLHNLIRVTISEIQEKKEIWRMVTAMSMQPDMYSFIHDIALSKRDKYFDMLEDLLIKLDFAHPRGEAMALAAVLDGIAMHFLVSGDDYPLDEIQNFLIEKYS